MPPSLPQNVSGPASAHVLDVPRPDGRGTHRFYIFGDVHFSYKNRCDPCRNDSLCETVTSLIRRLSSEAEASGNTLDVHLEMSYAPKDASYRDQVLTNQARQMVNDDKSSMSITALRRALSRSASTKLVGLLGHLYHQHKRQLYGPKKPGSKVRVHYADARAEPHVPTYTRPDAAWLRETYKTEGSFKAVLHAFMFSDDFPASMRAVFKEPIIDERLLSRLNGKLVHKIAKQYLQIPEGPVRRAVRAHLTARCDDMCRVALRDELHFPVGPKRAPLPRNAHESMLISVRENMDKARNEQLELVVQFDARVLLMDAYALCRALRYALYREDTVGGSTVMYAGDLHAFHYVDMLEHELDVKPAVCSERTQGDDWPKTSRCISMAPCRRRRRA